MALVIHTDCYAYKKASDSDTHFGCSAKVLLGTKDESRLTNMQLQNYSVKGETTSHVHHDREQYFYIIEGDGIFVIDGEEFAVRPHSFVFVPKDAEHSYRVSGDFLTFLMMQSFFSEQEMRSSGSYSQDWNEPVSSI